jgi:bifunctional NMN adenylyltransferase/nudix hydrolase
MINATYIRQRLFEGNLDISVISTESAELAANGMTDRVREEYKHVLAYKQQFSGYPYPPIFHTVDAVVVQSGHVLLVKRGAMPGKGLLALPGGFLNAHEKRLDGMLRELREETKIKVPERVLYGNIIKEETFDEPNRSSRGRTITTAYTIMLPNGPLPKIKGADDAEKAMWVPLSAVASNMMFEDHFDIIQVMVGKREKTC